MEDSSLTGPCRSCTLCTEQGTVATRNGPILGSMGCKAKALPFKNFWTYGAQSQSAGEAQCSAYQHDENAW